MRIAHSLRRALLLTLVLVSAVGCSGEPRGAAPSGTLVISLSSDIEGVNPLIAKSTSVSRDLMRFLFLKLLKENPDFKSGPPTFDPDLAEAYEFSDDGLRLTFHLRRNAVWSDGVPVTAADVRWTWRAQTDPAVAWSFGSKKRAVEDVEVVDDHTVIFHFSQSYPGQLADANEGSILPRHAWGVRPFSEWRSDARWFVDHAVTSGPFRFVAWVPAQEVRLERNERYYKSGLPKLEKVVLRVTADKASEVNQLLGGAVDYVKKVPLDQTERILRSPDLEIEPFWGRQYNYLTWNTQRPPLDDREIRRALTHSIDRQTIIDTLYGGRAKVSVAAILSSAWAFHDGLEPWAFDRAEAKRLFAAKGFSDGDGDGVLERAGAPFSLELKVNSGSSVQLNAATMIQEQLRQVGVELRLRPLEFSTWLEHVTSHDYDVAIGGWSVDTALDVSQAFHSDPAKGDYNFGSYSNPEVDRLIVEANLEVDLEVKRAKLHRLQELLHEDQPYTFLWEIQEVNARNRRVQGSQPNTISSFYNLAEWWVE